MNPNSSPADSEPIPVLEEELDVAEAELAVAEARLDVERKQLALAEAELAEEPTASSTKPQLENPALALSVSPLPDAMFQSSVAVSFRCDSPGALIRYSTSEDVDETDSIFDAKEKILLTQSTILAARAFQNGERGPLLRAHFGVKKALWQELEPVDRSDEVPHKLGGNLDSPDDWRSGAGSVRGKLHAHRALWREDSFALGFVDTPHGSWTVNIVSDGAGSAPLSRVGSRVACEAALRCLCGALENIEELAGDESTLTTDDLPKLRAALVEAATAALDAIRGEAQAREKPVSAFAATLLILVRRAWNNAQVCGALQVGDGAIALDCASGLKLLGEADHGQHSSETRFLTTQGVEAEFAARTKFSIRPDLRATLVVSDGVSDDYFPEHKRLGEVFEAVFPLAQTAPDAGHAFVDWLGYEKKGSSDDRTLVLSWPASNSETETVSSTTNSASSTEENVSSTTEMASSTKENASSTSEIVPLVNETASSTTASALIDEFAATSENAPLSTKNTKRLEPSDGA